MTSSSTAYDAVRLTPYGYYELAEKPTQEELRDYYASKYYQNSIRTHQHHYAEEDLIFRYNKLEQKRLKVESLRGDGGQQRRFLDIGAGEGFAMAHFARAGWDVTGLDYSSFGCETHHPDQLKSLIVGDVNESLQHLVKTGARFDLILMDNVLEHILDPLGLLKTVHELMDPGAVINIEVPNDFSDVQMRLLETGRVKEPFWVVAPDHISYFNHEGLCALAKAAGLETRAMMSDFPIDFALFNDQTNYVNDKSLGHTCHKARIEVENLMHQISPEAANRLYEAFGALRMGRQIVAFFQKSASEP